MIKLKPLECGSKEFGAIIILAYSLGLVATKTFRGALGAYGTIKSSDSQRLYRSEAFVTASFSIIKGILFLIGGTHYLPNLEALNTIENPSAKRIVAVVIVAFKSPPCLPEDAFK